MTTTVITEKEHFRLSVEFKECAAPKDLMAIYFIRDQLNDEKQVESTSVYEFFLYPEEISKLQKAFSQI